MIFTIILEFPDFMAIFIPFVHRPIMDLFIFRLSDCNMIIVKRKNKMRNVTYLEKSRVTESVLSNSKKKKCWSIYDSYLYHEVI